MPEVIMTKISDHKAKRGVSMYTFVHGSGKNRKSETKHCTASEAESYKKSLGGSV